MAELRLRGSHGRLRASALVSALLLAAGCGITPPRASDSAVSSAAGEPAVSDGAWLARVQEEIASREYRASENGHGLQAPNRAHNLRIWFERTGIRVHDRTAGGSPELLRLSLAGVPSNALYRWRGRVLHAAAAGAIPSEPSHGPWRRVGAQAVEADIRVLPEPGFFAPLLAGIGVSMLLGRRRRCSSWEETP